MISDCCCRCRSCWQWLVIIHASAFSPLSKPMHPMPLFFGARSQPAAGSVSTRTLWRAPCRCCCLPSFPARRSVGLTPLFQVPLTDDGACQGGLLVFACDDGRLVHAKRRTGNILAHDGDAVHGVTALVKGVRLAARYSTFLSHHFLFSLPPISLCPYLYSYTSSHVWAVRASRAKSTTLVG